MTTAHEPEVLEQEIAPSSALTAGGSVDVQVATARRFPRSIATFIRRAQEMAILTPEIAASCVYALPRDGKTIEGPSARLAEIVASAWGNLRIQAGATENDDRYITARGEAWDVETNVAIGFEVRRRITNRNGQTFSDDMITVTGNAAASIALRNAVFKAVPSSFWKPIYQKCRQVIAGDAKTFAARRDEMLKAFMVAGVTNERLCTAIGLKGVQDISLDHMATLVGILNALKEGEITVEEAFPESGGIGAPQPARRKSEQATADHPAVDAAAPEQAAAALPPPAKVTGPEVGAALSQASSTPAYIGMITKIEERPNGAVLTLSTGFRCGTGNVDLIVAAQTHKIAGNVVELVTKPARRDGLAPVLEEIVVTSTDEVEQ